MSSILTNTSAMNALATLRSVNKGLEDTQNRISTGKKINSAKDNAAYFSISESMNSDSGMYKSINEGLTLTKNSVSTARLGAESVKDLAQQFVERVSFAQGDAVDHAAVQKELRSIVDQIGTTISQATFNGDSLVDGSANVTVVTGISRASGSFATTSMTFQAVDLSSLQATLSGIDISGGSAAVLTSALTSAQSALSTAIDNATSLGVAEKSLEAQQNFLGKLTDKLDTGVGNMVDADMEQEAARLQSYQVQQQLATQSLSIANQGPQNLLSLFR
ncbi:MULTISPECIES: flagellin [unclassified Thioclava]|uniref:flagellin N-terminal helical domain-containing protein n=1 Tax=unclassified Thioclava TaxID=2621713 RepID=UPI000B548780|nr:MULTISPECIES: flagellin [unclassified Thioclava]OWY00884.1 flagellar protein [Thioclava sp. IC9]OWY08570.1 flagellar protein [Thioclava sp. F42-5]OWY11732.1 flagellar protein [Thioclava sp. F34-6]OWY15737.1 flagellar protein [Thioclava sp. JM3]PWE49453.1 flagellar protein [Thioclava sp. NG1]